MTPNFDNSFAQLGASFSRPQTPEPVSSPELLAVNHSLARELGFDPQWLESSDGVAVIAGNTQLSGTEPISSAYAGHQFGTFNPQLGDGRAILLGEVTTADGRRFDIQLKGSGRTHWSRGGDGRSPLGPVLREYLVSEAMTSLGVPSTRALAAVTTGDRVIRERPEPGAILARVASSHLRVGTVQFFASRNDLDSVAALTHYAIDRHYPERADAKNPALELLHAVVSAQAKLIAHWQHLGFIHGVMNTDNMLLCGETVDYGPCAFMESFDPATVFSSIDHQGRYAYQNQPGIAHWNLTRLAEALLPLIDSDTDQAIKLATEAIQRFATQFEEHYRQGLAAKLGLASPPEDRLLEGLFSALQTDHADFTLAFRFLAEQARASAAIDCPEYGAGAEQLFKPGTKLLEWIPLWMQALGREQTDANERVDAMFRANPIFIPRNHQVQKAIRDAEDGDLAHFHRLHRRLGEPFNYSEQDQDLALPAEPQERVFQTFCGT